MRASEPVPFVISSEARNLASGELFLKLGRFFVFCATQNDNARDDQVSEASLERSTKILKAIESFLDHVDAGGVAEPNGAIVAEGSPRHDRDIRFAQQTIRKILRGQAELADIHQYVKGALRFDRSHVGNFGNAIKHVVAAHIEFIAHVRNRWLIALEGRERAP